MKALGHWFESSLSHIESYSKHNSYSIGENKDKEILVLIFRETYEHN